MADLVDFVRARVDEDERKALAAADAFLHGDRIGMPSLHPSVHRHVYTWTSARVLDEVEAKRLLLDRYEAMRAGVDAAAGTVLAGAAKVRLGAYEFAVKCLALPHSGHLDYRPGWRP